MDQKLFDELVKDYVTKHIDPDNGIVTYELIRKPRRINFKVGDVPVVTKEGTTEFKMKKRTGLRINTPVGLFNSVREASDAVGISTTLLHYRINKNTEQYKDYFYVN